MKLYTIGDLHLSQGTEKPMEVFGDGWLNYTERICENWIKTVKGEDTVLLCGDISWGIDLNESLSDLKLIDALPGKKILLKGNHDYWWGTKKSMEAFFEANALSSFSILHNNYLPFKSAALCGTKGWFYGSQEDRDSDEKILNRELIRLENSLKAADKDGFSEKIVFLHYPPVFDTAEVGEILSLLIDYHVKRCYYGHLHGSYAHSRSINGIYRGIDLYLVSADFLEFMPIEVEV